MTREDIIELATKVYGECDWHESALHHLEAFAKLVDAKATARERDTCKSVCEKSRYAKQDEWRVTRSMIVSEIIEAIDARGEA
jgi:hypothetical protein